MRVYHFLPSKWALEDIEKQHIRISTIDELNDPFELWCVSQTDPRLRKPLRGYREEMAHRFGMICYSRRWNNPLLWSHYADKNRGICLGFDVDERCIRQVIYVRERTNLRIPPTIESMDELLYTKYEDWKYEEEWRGWFTLDERDPSGHYFYPFSDRMVLREVIVGPLCETPKAKVDEAQTHHSHHVRVMKARLAFKTFQIVRNREAFRH